jgi:ribosomal-protein-alanine N-acetyltransferase
MEIEGPGFTLRGWKPTDAESLQKHADNFKLYCCLTDKFPHPYTMADAMGWVIMMKDQDPMINFAIAIDGNVAGAIGLERRSDVYRKTALIGYWLGEEYWGRGIMPEAVKLVAAYAFANLDFIRLQAGVFSNNSKSMRVLEKAGFTKEGILKSSIIKNDVILDEHLYALVKG